MQAQSFCNILMNFVFYISPEIMCNGAKPEYEEYRACEYVVSEARHPIIAQLSSSLDFLLSHKVQH
jgi:hypothetical protein